MILPIHVEHKPRSLELAAWKPPKVADLLALPLEGDFGGVPLGSPVPSPYGNGNGEQRALQMREHRAWRPLFVGPPAFRSNVQPLNPCKHTSSTPPCLQVAPFPSELGRQKVRFSPKNPSKFKAQKGGRAGEAVRSGSRGSCPKVQKPRRVFGFFFPLRSVLSRPGAQQLPALGGELGLHEEGPATGLPEREKKKRSKKNHPKRSTRRWVAFGLVNNFMFFTDQIVAFAQTCVLSAVFCSGWVKPNPRRTRFDAGWALKHPAWLGGHDPLLGGFMFEAWQH